MTGKQGLAKCPIYKENGDINITCDFGNRIHPITRLPEFHTGIDAVRNNNAIATIVAIEDGTVIDLDNTVLTYDTAKTKGNYVRLKHQSGRQSMYLHLAYATMPQAIKVGANVKKGQMLGMMGDTGMSTGSHIHFQIYDTDGATIIDPKPFIFGKNINDLSTEEDNGMFIKITPCKYKDKGDAVVNLQKKLAQQSEALEAEIKGHSFSNGKFDGVFGKGLVLTVQNIQAKAGLKPTGECDADFCKLLNGNVIDLSAKTAEAIEVLSH